MFRSAPPFRTSKTIRSVPEMTRGPTWFSFVGAHPLKLSRSEPLVNPALE